MLTNLHPDFKVQGLSCRLAESAPQLTREYVEPEIRAVHEALSEKYGKLDRKELKQIDMLQPYIRYFKQFKKTYHLFLQIESFIHKNRPLPFIIALVTAYFLAELETGVLGSAHDLDKMVPPVTLEKSAGGEPLTLINGEQRSAPPGDALLKDSSGLLTCVIQGQDTRTVLSPDSRNAAYFVYAPPGVEESTLTDSLEVLAGHLRNWYGNDALIEGIFPENPQLPS